MPKPRISVVIPTYNREELITEAIDSVLAQTYRDFEIIVVDDGSRDRTSDRVAQYGDRITYHVQENCGVAAARNAGIRLSQGEFVCFLDSDDLWKPQKLATQIRFADAHPEYALLSTELQGFDADGKVGGRRKAEMYTIRNGLVIEDLLFGNWIQTSTVMLRRDCLDEAGWFDEDVGQFGEDWLLWMRVVSRFPIYFLPEPLVSYRIHPERLSHYQPEIQFQSLMSCLRKISTLPQFQQNSKLIREAEYRICMGRARMNLHRFEYGLARAKLQRACKLRRVPLRAAYLLVRASLEDTLAGRVKK